jgi:hypothetical protein
LVDLITYAYGVRYDQVTGGTAWISNELAPHNCAR